MWELWDHSDHYRINLSTTLLYSKGNHHWNILKPKRCEIQTILKTKSSMILPINLPYIEGNGLKVSSKKTDLFPGKTRLVVLEGPEASPVSLPRSPCSWTPYSTWQTSRYSSVVSQPQVVGWINYRKGAVHPWRLTWNIIMEVWKIIFLPKWVICSFHVNLPGCNMGYLMICWISGRYISDFWEVWWLTDVTWLELVKLQWYKK